MESAGYHHDLALLEWQFELGATEAICDAPVNRYDLPAQFEKPKTSQAVAPGKIIPLAQADPVAVAQAAAAQADSLDALRGAMMAFDHCELKKGARNLVFSDGRPEARVMVIAEAPGRDEDLAGKPFVGKAGQLLDKMFGAIDMGRDHADDPIYITNVLPWRTPQNRDPKPDEIAMMKPFLMRHIELVQPEFLVLVGNWSCQTLLGKKGITRLRGEWTNVGDIPALPMFHPAYLLRSPEFKREAWSDLLSLRARALHG